MTIIDFNNAKLQDELRRQGGVDATDIRERLANSAKEFVLWLFSGRAVIGKHEARIGDTNGTPGESLAIQLSGKDKGMWFDHATGEGGDLISLYRAYMGYQGNSDFQLSLKEIAKDFFGDPVEVERSQWRPAPKEVIEKKKAELGTKPPAHVVELGAPVESYPYYGRDGNILLVGRRYEPGPVDANGKPEKTIRYTSWPQPRPLYRIPEILSAVHVVLCEGERCADALAGLGIEATTAMGGANTKIELVDWSPIAGKNVAIWPDNDKNGFEYAERVAPLLANLKCTVSIVQVPEGKPPKWDAYDLVQEGGEPYPLINDARPYTSTPPAKIPILSLVDLRKLPALQWLIQDWLPADSLGFIYGDPGCGKSFLALDWCLHIAGDMPRWHGADIKQHGAVLYILQEGGRGTVNRVDAFHKKWGTEDSPNFELITTALSFLDVHCVNELIESVTARGKKYLMIVVDTVSRVLPGADENLQKEMTLFIHACDRLRRLSNACVIGVHHASKGGDLRGSSVLRGAGEFVYKLEKEPGVRPIELKCEKLKDEENGWKRTLTLEKVKVSDNPEGLDFNKPVTSLVITEVVSEDAAMGDDLPSRGVCQEVLNNISDAWQSGNPWSHKPQTKDAGRYAVDLMYRRFKIPEKTAKRLLSSWLAEDILQYVDLSKKDGKKGLRVVKNLAEVGGSRVPNPLESLDGGSSAEVRK